MHTIGVIGQLCFGIFWFGDGLESAFNFNDILGLVRAKRVPFAPLAAIIAILLLILGGAGVLLGVYFSYAIGLLLIFTIPVTLIVHNFWSVTDPKLRAQERIAFFSNFALTAALLMLLALPAPFYGLF